MNVATKIWKRFFQILDESFPPGHPLHTTFNRPTVKLSYSTMPNMLKRISVHNSRVTTAALADVTLVSDDNNTNEITLASDDNNANDNSEKLVPTALPCNDCSDECGGYTVENVPAEIPDNEDEVVDEEDEDQESHHCNCNGRMGPCPLDGDCRKEKSCIYSCKVTRLDTGV